MIKKLVARVRGKVQGVGYRFFVQHQAALLGLKGVARNQLDGSVEVILEGEEEKLRKILRLLHIGPPLSRVISVEHSFHEASGEFIDIEVE